MGIENKCIICGKKGVMAYRDVCSDECFTEKFWLEKIQWKRKGDLTNNERFVARINGNHYSIGSEKEEQKGFSGGKFIVKFTSGPHKDRVIKTTNLWDQGQIPEKFKDILSNNAIFGLER